MRALLTEVLSNLFPLRSRRSLVSLAVVVVALLNTLLLTADWSSLRTSEEVLVAEGWNVLFLNSNDRAIPPGACRGLESLVGVTNSGTVRRSTEANPNSLLVPVLVDYQLVENVREPDPFTSASLGSRGVVALIELEGRLWPVSATPTDLARWRLGSSGVFRTQNFGPVNQCIYEVDLAWAGTLEHVPTALVGAINGRVQLTGASLLSPRSHPYPDFLERTTRWVPIASGLLLAALYAAVATGLRNQTALYRTVGAGRSDMWLYYSTEVFVLLVVGATFSALSVATVNHLTLLPLWASVSYLALGGLTFMVPSLVAAAWLAGGNAISQMKDR